MVLILPLDSTVRIFSEYRRTASVLSSCSGKDTFTSAFIQSGAPASAGRGSRTRQTATPRVTTHGLIPERLIWQQHNLLLIACPHSLKKIAQRRVVLSLHHQDIQAEMAVPMPGATLTVGN